MELQNRYMVIKITDTERHLYESERCILRNIDKKIDLARSRESRGPLAAIVIEADWPEYEKVLKLLSDRVDEKRKSEIPIKIKMKNIDWFRTMLIAPIVSTLVLIIAIIIFRAVQ